MKTITTINPVDGTPIQNYPVMGTDEIEEKLATAVVAFRWWRKVPMPDRSQLLKRVASQLREKKAELAELITHEMGKPVTQSLAEIEKCASCCDYFAENGPKNLQDESIQTEARRSFVSFQPLGPLLAVMPWNFPFWQVFRCLAPALMAGNTILLKHSSNTTGCAIAIERIIHDAYGSHGLLQTLLADHETIESLIADFRVRAVTLTGSTPAGRRIAGLAGAHLKKTVLELGGSDAYIILSDADLDLAVQVCTTGRLINTGQSCIAAKRFIVDQSIYRDFCAKMVALMRTKKMGDPMDPQTDLGPMARADLRDELHQQVKKSLDRGAELLCGGEIPQGPGSFYPATVLGSVTPGMVAFEEELFGPVAAVISARNEEEAIHLANQTEFGLGGGIISRNIEHAEKIARDQMEAGCCFVNDFVKSDSRLPFGGIKNSGYGRELSAFGLREFVNIKTVLVR